MKSVKIAVYAAGEKGRAFLTAMMEYERSVVVDVRTYPQAGTLDDSAAEIATLCAANHVRLHLGARNTVEVASEVDLVFVVGWQYLLPPDSRMVVFHDSLLPRYRGFAPTVTALIAGDTDVGVTALRPLDEPDSGPILAQHAQRVQYPAKIRNVLHQLTDAYVACAREVIDEFAADTLSETPQDPNAATYSVWRDDEDYFINWADDADRICRTVDALGWPYPGARTRVGEMTLTVLEAERGPDMQFEIGQPGKIWSLSDGAPTVICGNGTVVLTDVRDPDGNSYRFNRLRVRLA
jgi:methionyl-tRNA formyltransferase